MHVRIKEGSVTQKILVTVQPGDKQAVNRVDHMLACIGRDITSGVNTTLYYAQQEETRRKVMAGYLVSCILSYIHDEDMPSVACTNKDFGDKVNETRTTKEAYEHS